LIPLNASSGAGGDDALEAGKCRFHGDCIVHAELKSDLTSGVGIGHEAEQETCLSNQERKAKCMFDP